MKPAKILIRLQLSKSNTNFFNPFVHHSFCSSINNRQCKWPVQRSLCWLPGSPSIGGPVCRTGPQCDSARSDWKVHWKVLWMMWMSCAGSGTCNALKLPTLDLAFHSSRVARASKSSRGEVMEAICLSEGKAERVLRSSAKIIQIICVKCWGSRNVVSLRWRWQHPLAICEGNRYDFQYPAWLVFSWTYWKSSGCLKPCIFTSTQASLWCRFWARDGGKITRAKSPPLQWVHLTWKSWKAELFCLSTITVYIYIFVCVFSLSILTGRDQKRKRDRWHWDCCGEWVASTRLDSARQKCQRVTWIHWLIRDLCRNLLNESLLAVYLRIWLWIFFIGFTRRFA